MISVLQTMLCKYFLYDKYFEKLDTTQLKVLHILNSLSAVRLPYDVV